ncbi:NADH:flavin oxidoreductase/NADH oxidase [Frondihabitans australicus]|uniref:2,4-dienoyl-CoA reductase-like NADH-dependent reductase (Old Yellow Enzyme family) n=1 Tax=Frondihabitans australicus TaxID=386892 RepID=A0A495IDB2_9MICO|nr:NADH:flavin oxidoreductase/NADH oxidase [Frondihabitans australicus]RKR73997.1 2,4-dienoyl-CoA reductase-like NADH-dependent reductase (Old Yellow Enzyme family) [Frondihabitans australicus]
MPESARPHLFSPITLRGMEFRNRLWVPALTMFTVESRDGMPSDFHFVHLGAIATGGAGAVIAEATSVEPAGRASPHDVGLWNDAQRDSWARISRFAKEYGTRIGIQLGHAGRKASQPRSWEPQIGTLPTSMGGWTTVGPSAVAYQGLDVPHELTGDEVRAMVRAFADAARRAQEAGFDFVEIHAAHGFLIHQFLSPISNRRRDEYGGSLENRARFFLEIVTAIRETVGESMPLLARVSATDWVEGGWNEEETALVTAWAQERGVDFFDVSTGGLVPDATIPVFPGYQVQFADRLKAAADATTGAVGLILTPAQAAEIVESGQADVAFVGREFLRDPHFGLRAAHELGVDIDYYPQPYHRARFRSPAA